MNTFYMETLGCKVNQYESDGIASCLEKKGWIQKKRGQGADLCIINTCAVTSRAGMQSRQAIRRIIRENPLARILVTGCHVQTDPDQVDTIEGIDLLVGHRDKTLIPEFGRDLVRGPKEISSVFRIRPVDHTPSNRFLGFPHAIQGTMTRPYLKIQDGCNAFCSYCIVPHARGASVSMHENQVLDHLRQLAGAGFKEVILTGIHTGMYGRDLEPRSSLADLVEKIERSGIIHRIRLSSIEPKEIDTRLLDLAASGKVVCDHFHIPLQSGDDNILKKMKRPYTGDYFKNIIHKIHSRLPHAGIGVDTLIGFPSETQDQFLNTYDLIKKLPVSYLHVFPFSPRKGTPAYDLEPKVDHDTIKNRCRVMRELGIKKKKAFIESNMGRPLKGLVQHREANGSGRLKAVTSNYLTIEFEPGNKPGLKGEIVDIVIEKWDKDLNLFGRLVNHCS